ncbi:MAG: hypothetical protein M3Y73_22755 [Actinomycetota bacterium]|nr:hypothetical protein [Actinomycetota bacterium]
MIALEGVSKTYPKQSKPALAELNLQVPEGAIVTLIGPSVAARRAMAQAVSAET